MGCNSSKDGATAANTSNAPAPKPEENASNGQGNGFSAISDEDNTVEMDNDQTEVEQIVIDGGQVIINDDTETQSLKDKTSDGQGRLDEPVAEEDNTARDGDVIENTKQEEIEVKVDDNPQQNEDVGGEDQAATDSTPAATEDQQQDSQPQEQQQEDA